MAVNRDKPDRWKQDITWSVDMYNDWFLRFAPEAYRMTRVRTTDEVGKTLRAPNNLRNVRVTLLKKNPIAALDRWLTGIGYTAVAAGTKYDELPLLIEAKSAGDFTNVNKRRKEEAAKMNQLRRTYGLDVRLILFLCGYFDSGYLGYEAVEGIDWVWEHRIDDLREFGL